MTGRDFPILMSWRLADHVSEILATGGHVLVVALPWALLEPHERQARHNHGQSLKGLASRGGLSHCEAVAVLEDREWRKMPLPEANAKLAAAIRALSGDGQ